MSQTSDSYYSFVDQWLEEEVPSPPELLPVNIDFPLPRPYDGSRPSLLGLDLNPPSPEQLDSVGLNPDLDLDATSDFLEEMPDQEASNLMWEELLAGTSTWEQLLVDSGGAGPMTEADSESDTMVATVEFLSEAEARPAERRVAVEDFPVVAVGAAEMARGASCCAVCMEDYTEGESVSRLPCGHCFHKDCLSPWFQKRVTCPICRFKLV